MSMWSRKQHFASTSGRACHSSRPEQGLNAIYQMARLLTGIEQYGEALRLKSGYTDAQNNLIKAQEIARKAGGQE